MHHAEAEVVKHPNVRRFERDPVKRRINQHWREKHGTIILRGREKERRAREEREEALKKRLRRKPSDGEAADSSVDSA